MLGIESPRDKIMGAYAIKLKTEINGIPGQSKIIKKRYAINGVNPAYYTNFNVNDINNAVEQINETQRKFSSIMSLDKELQVKVFDSYKTYGDFTHAFDKNFANDLDNSDLFFQNLKAVFSYLVSNNINTDEISLFWSTNLSVFIVACVFGILIKCPDAKIKNGKKFYDYVKNYAYEKNEYLRLVSEKSEHPICGMDFFANFLKELCDEVDETLKKEGD